MLLIPLGFRFFGCICFSFVILIPMMTVEVNWSSFLLAKAFKNTAT